MAAETQRRITPTAISERLSGDLMALAALYGRANGLGMAMVGVRMRNDQRFFTDKVARGAFTAATYDAAMQWFATNWPDGVTWPDHVWRPK